MRHSKKIVVVACMKPDSKTGVTTYYKLLHQYLDEYKIVIVTPADAPWMAKKMAGAYFILFSALFPNSAMTAIRYNLFLLRFALTRTVREEQVTFHAQDTISAFTVRQLFKKARIITTCHYNDDPVTEINLEFKLTRAEEASLRSQYQRFFSVSDEFICVSQYVADRSKKFFPPAAPVSIIYNGIDFKSIRGDRRPKRADKLVITNCGTLEDRKNQILLVEVAKELIGKGFHNFEVWLIGIGGNFGQYQNEIEKHGLQNHVKMLGWQEKPWKIISESHLYLHTALNEAFGYAVVEAIAAGTFAMGIDVGGLSEVLEADSLVPAREAKNRFVDTILSFDFDEIATRATHQYEITARKFDIAVWGEKHACVYQ